MLEIRCGLDINNSNHIWLLHLIFLPTINAALRFFAEAWNEHQIQIRGGPNRSPTDMFYFDMLVHGVRGESLGDMMSNEELEVYGIDWAALQDDDIRQSHLIQNGIQEGETSWIGHTGPPPALNLLLMKFVSTLPTCHSIPRRSWIWSICLLSLGLAGRMMSRLHKLGRMRLLMLGRSAIHFRE